MTTLANEGITSVFSNSRETSEKLSAVPLWEKFDTSRRNRMALNSSESSGRRSAVSPAGLASAAVASSAIEMNAPPIPVARAPGLLKLNSNCEKFSVLVCARSPGTAQVTSRTPARISLSEVSCPHGSGSLSYRPDQLIQCHHRVAERHGVEECLNPDLGNSGRDREGEGVGEGRSRYYRG